MIEKMNPFRSIPFLYAPDDPPSGSPDPEKKNDVDPEKKDGKPNDEKPKDEKTLTLSESEFTSRVENAVKERMERERKRTEKEAEKIRQEEREKSLAEQQKFEELATERQIRINELEAHVAKVEPELDELKKKFARYEKSITAHLETQRKDLPAHVVKLLDRLDPVDQLEYIAENSETLRSAPKKPVPETPNPESTNLSEDLRKQAERNSAAFYRNTF